MQKCSLQNLRKFENNLEDLIFCVQIPEIPKKCLSKLIKIGESWTRLAKSKHFVRIELLKCEMFDENLPERWKSV